LNRCTPRGFSATTTTEKSSIGTVFSLQSVPRCYKQDSWRQSSVGKNVSTEAEDIVGICHQATTGKDIGKGLVCAVVNCRACELAIAL
jgi:hypothetical protein